MKYISKIVKNIMENIPRYSTKKLLLSFEYGVILKDVAKDKLDSEMVKRAENIILSEFSKKPPTKLATEMIPNLLASIEPK